MAKADDMDGVSETGAAAVEGALQPGDGEREAAAVPETPTPRDETAFSYDPFTGAPAASQRDLHHATAAMQALDRGDVDEAGYHRMLAEGPADETSNSGDEAPPSAPESGAAGSTSEAP